VLGLDKIAADKATLANCEDLCRQTPEGRLVLAKLCALLECYAIDLRDDLIAGRERWERAERDARTG
jgi:hypothetical protein